MHRLLALSALLLATSTSAAPSWHKIGFVSGAAWGSYSAFAQHPDGNVHFIINNSWGPIDGVYYGRVSRQILETLPGTASPLVQIIPEGVLGAYQDERGQPMTYARTNAVAFDGAGCHALLHVGAPYGSPAGYEYRPAYAASPDCLTWQYYGPVTVDGVPGPRTFSSSMAYVIVDGTHYMLQDEVTYGPGGLAAFRSFDGFNYETYGESIVHFLEDAPVFPDMAHCQGAFHITYENGWNRGGVAVRHLKSEDALAWELVEEAIRPSSYKGMNIGCVDGRLLGVVGTEVWEWKEVSGGSRGKGKGKGKGKEKRGKKKRKY